MQLTEVELLQAGFRAVDYHLIINGGHVDGNAGPDAGGIFVGDVNELAY